MGQLYPYLFQEEVPTSNVQAAVGSEYVCLLPRAASQAQNSSKAGPLLESHEWLTGKACAVHP